MLLLTVSALWGAATTAIVFSYLIRNAEQARAQRVRRLVGGNAVDRSRLSRALLDASTTIKAPAGAPIAILAVALLAGIWGVGLGIQQAIMLAMGAGALILFMRRPKNVTGRLQRQTPAATSLLASGLRAGYSVLQSLQLVAREAPEPTASRFAAVSREVELGVGFDDAFSRMAEQTRLPDYRLLSVLISIQHSAGGNLVQALEGVGDVLRERSALREQVGSITAQQRLSSLVLTILPIALLAIVWAISPSYLDLMLGTTTGQILLFFAGLLLLMNWFVMRAAGRVDL
jgi:Flp pilus assembly protein TadB